MVLEVAVNGQADAIVTFNRRDFQPATERFGIEIPGRLTEGLLLWRSQTRTHGGVGGEEPLLFKGGDFAYTDIGSILPVGLCCGRN